MILYCIDFLNDARDISHFISTIGHLTWFTAPQEKNGQELEDWNPGLLGREATKLPEISQAKVPNLQQQNDQTIEKILEYVPRGLLLNLETRVNTQASNELFLLSSLSSRQGSPCFQKRTLQMRGCVLAIFFLWSRPHLNEIWRFYACKLKPLQRNSFIWGESAWFSAFMFKLCCRW